MIPISLSIRNFMCYRENVPALLFDGLHLICLSGDNGNGKSALIDAMTWALWGKARAESDDELISAMQTDMGIEFEFAIGSQKYRIIRKRSRAKTQKSSGVPTLDFQLATEGDYRSIAGNTMTETQQKISEVLHMDYDTFINSAYLRQGHADEFTTKPPGKRKEVLGNILGLFLYDRLSEQAREMERQQKSSKAQLENSLQEIEAEISRRPEYEAELDQAQQTLDSMEETIDQKENQLKQLRLQKEDLDKKGVELEQLSSRVNDNLNNIAIWEEQAEQHQSRINEYEELLAQRDSLEENYARFNQVKNLCDELNRKFKQLVNLERQKVQLETRTNEANQALKTEHRLLEQKIADLTARADKHLSLQDQRRELQEKLTGFRTDEQLLKDKEQSYRERQTQVSLFEAQVSRVEQEIKEIGEKLDLLSDRAEANCPLCETELGHEGVDIIRAKYEAEKISHQEAIPAKHNELKERKAELEVLQQEITRLGTQLNNEKASQQSQMQLIESRISEAEEAKHQMAEAKISLDEIEQRLARKDFATTEQRALLEMENEISNLGYDEAQHTEAQQQLTQLERYEQLYRKLTEADNSIQREKETVVRATSQVDKLKKSMSTDKQQIEHLEKELAGLPSLRSALTQFEDETKTLGQQRQQAQEILGHVKAKLEHCLELEMRKKEKEKLYSQSAREEAIYHELVEAFGKNGIQLLLIEIALPEIENETNLLLSRMTDNRMTVKFETQKASKKGEVMDILDINIADELGTRNYEMFSGGEAFRINFAIRIALSRLLTKRAGAPLQTLIIDEGFGTQDTTGIEKLKEAINTIKDDFQKIIVITHIEELRDAFPTRIDVVKTAEGATFSVN
ncbi:AAA family ATPase [Chloroflexota bacterium]